MMVMRIVLAIIVLLLCAFPLPTRVRHSLGTQPRLLVMGYLNLSAQSGNPSGKPASDKSGLYKVSGRIEGIDVKDGKKLYLLLLDGSTNQYGADGKGKMQTPFSLVIDAATPVFEFVNVPNGDYIIVCFQDKNGDGKLSTGAFGAPTEKWGTYPGKSTTSLVSFASGHFTISGQNRTDCNFDLPGFHW